MIEEEDCYGSVRFVLFSYLLYMRNLEKYSGVDGVQYLGW